MSTKKNTAQTAPLLDNLSDIELLDIPPYEDNDDPSYYQMVNEYLRNEPMVHEYDHKIHEIPSYTIVEGIQSEDAIRLVECVRLLNRISDECYNITKSLGNYYNTIYMLNYFDNPKNYNEMISQDPNYESLKEHIFTFYHEVNGTLFAISELNHNAREIQENKKLVNLKYFMEN